MRFIRSFLTSTACWLGIAISLILSLMAAELVEDKAKSAFESHTSNAELAVKARVQSYIDVLRGVAALFSTSDGITRDQFRDYFNQLDITKSFPGIGNINFAPHVRATDRESFIESVRRDTSRDAHGYPDFAIKPAGNRAEYHVLTYQEPHENHLSTFGFDIASIPTVKKSLEIARDTGQLSASGKLIRVTGPNRRIALAMRLPLYRRGMPVNTVAERRAAYYGSVGAGFDINKLMTGAIDKNTLRHMRVKLYDTGQSGEKLAAGTVDPVSLLFDSADSDVEDGKPVADLAPGRAFVKRAQLALGARVWEAEFVAEKTAMLSPLDIALPWLIFGASLTASFLLYSIYYSLASARRRAVEMATDMTRDLRTSEATLAEAQHMAHLGSWLLDPQTGRMQWSNETYRILGLHHFTDTLLEDFLRRVHDDDRQMVKQKVNEVTQNGQEASIEHRVVQHGGNLRWVQSIVRADHDADVTMLRGTIMDITERKETVDALKRSQELLRDLTTYQDRVKEEERKRIAREIHDELGQTLLALRIDVAMLEARTGNSHPRLNQKVRSVLSHIDATVKTIRTIINNLRPAVLDLGLIAAFEWQVSEFQRRSGIRCELIIGTPDITIDDTRATTLFRVLQESLTNVLRHAEATKVVIRLYQEQDRLVLKITDNGIGIYPTSRRKANSFGLIGVEERIYALNGKCLISGAPGEGTTLSIYIPITNPVTEPVV